MNSTIEACNSKSSLVGNPTTVSTGRGSHVAALRSLGLLHELQEHVANLQQTAAEQEKELNRLKGQKREAERMLRKEPRPDAQPIMQQFERAEIVDLPPKLRALFEDNKVLKEEVRRYKCRVKEAEQLSATQQQQLARLQAQVQRYKQQLAEGVSSPEALAAEELARQQVDSAARALQKLQEAHRILQQKLEADARSHKQALAAAAKERHQLEQQITELQQQLDAKDKESRANVLAAKKAERRLQDVKSSAAVAVAGVADAVAKAVAEEKERHKRAVDASVHLMLCVLKEPQLPGNVVSDWAGQQQQQVKVTSAEAVCSREGSLLAAKTTVQPYADEGFSQQTRYTREQAVQVIQAATRGYITRRQLKESRQLEEHAAVLIQAGPKHRACKQTAASAEQQQHLGPPREVLLVTAETTNSLGAGKQPDVDGGDCKLHAVAQVTNSSTGGSCNLRNLPCDSLIRPAGAAAVCDGGVATAAHDTVGAAAAGGETVTAPGGLPMELPVMPAQMHTAAGTAATSSTPGGGASAGTVMKQASNTARVSTVRSRASAPPGGRSMPQPTSAQAAKDTSTTSPRRQATSSRSGSGGPGSSLGSSMRSTAHDQQQQQPQRLPSRQRAHQALLEKSKSCRGH